MLTDGQLNSLSTAGGGVSPTACDLDPNSWLKRLPIEGEVSDDVPPNRLLPPEQPDSITQAPARKIAMRRRFAAPAPWVGIISWLRIIRRS
jgi:hypothetical protein